MTHTYHLLTKAWVLSLVLSKNYKIWPLWCNHCNPSKWANNGLYNSSESSFAYGWSSGKVAIYFRNSCLSKLPRSFKFISVSISPPFLTSQAGGSLKNLKDCMAKNLYRFSRETLFRVARGSYSSGHPSG